MKYVIYRILYKKKKDSVSHYAKEKFVSLGEKSNITLVEWNHDHDHVHILFKAHPNSELSKFINGYKSSSSRLIKKDFPFIRKKLREECFGQGVSVC